MPEVLRTSTATPEALREAFTAARLACWIARGSLRNARSARALARPSPTREPGAGARYAAAWRIACIALLRARAAVLTARVQVAEAAGALELPEAPRLAARAVRADDAFLHVASRGDPPPPGAPMRLSYRGAGTPPGRPGPSPQRPARRPARQPPQPAARAEPPRPRHTSAPPPATATPSLPPPAKLAPSPPPPAKATPAAPPHRAPQPRPSLSLAEASKAAIAATLFLLVLLFSWALSSAALGLPIELGLHGAGLELPWRVEPAKQKAQAQLDGALRERARLEGLAHEAMPATCSPEERRRARKAFSELLPRLTELDAKLPGLRGIADAARLRSPAPDWYAEAAYMFQLLYPGLFLLALVRWVAREIPGTTTAARSPRDV